MSAAGTSNAADGGPEEYYVSAPFELPYGARAAAVSWDADVPAKTWVKAQLRAADTAERLKREPWPAGWLENGGRTSAPGKWAQYRLALGAVNSGRHPARCEGGGTLRGLRTSSSPSSACSLELVNAHRTYATVCDRDDFYALDIR